MSAHEWNDGFAHQYVESKRNQAHSSKVKLFLIIKALREQRLNKGAGFIYRLLHPVK